MTTKKRISFGQFDAARIYELIVGLENGMGKKLECVCCPLILRRLRRFIGESEARSLIRAVEKKPYVKK